MAFVTAPWQVFVLRAIQGLFAGYGPIAMTMAAESAPPEQVATAIGWVQTAQRLGPALGPVIGGTLAQARRAAQHVSRLGDVLSRRASARRSSGTASAHRRAAAAAEPAARCRDVRGRCARVPHFMLFMATVFGLQLVDRSFGPILPLYLREAGAGTAVMPFLAGVIFTTTAGAAARRQSDARLAAAALAAVAARARRRRRWRASATFVFGAGAPIRRADRHRRVMGLGLGVATTAVYTAATHAVPPSARTVAFGYLTTAYLVGLAVSPVIAGLRRIRQRAGRVSRRRHRAWPAGVDRPEADVRTAMTVLTVDPVSCRAEDLRDAVEWLRAGGIVAFPTDTFYGLAVDPASPPAVRDLFRLKGRQAEVAVPLIASSLAQVEALRRAVDAGHEHAGANLLAGPAVADL